jgi:Mg2+/Co2+ transporter CorB
VHIEGVQPEKDGSLLVDGQVTIRDLNRQFDWYLPDDEASTIAGLILHETRRIPDVGQIFVFHGCRFEIVGRLRNQITSVRLERLNDDGTNESGTTGTAASA